MGVTLKKDLIEIGYGILVILFVINFPYEPVAGFLGRKSDTVAFLICAACVVIMTTVFLRICKKQMRR